MPYNGSGSFILSQAAFVPGTPISSSAMNADLSDIAQNGLSNAIVKDGQTTITGAFKAADGTVSLPMYAFASDHDSGMYRIGANHIGIGVGGAEVLDITTSGLDVTGTLLVNGSPITPPVINALTITPQGRLTLATATPVMTATTTGNTTIFYTPYTGNLVTLYDGSVMSPTEFTELSVLTTNVTKNPAAIGASKVNDWFVWNDAGTLRIGHGPDWTNDTTRSAGTALIMVKGVLLNNASITNGAAAQRATYVGTTRSNGSSQLDWIYGAVGANGTAGFHGVWNAYNRIAVSGMVRDSTDSWTYTTATVRSANGSNTMRVSFVSGLEENPFFAQYNAAVLDGSGHSVAGVGYDVTNAFSGLTAAVLTAGGINYLGGEHVTTAIGFHFFQACEWAQAAGTATWFGDDGGAIPLQTGMIYNLMM